jgi:Ca2+-binding EF-hand superfamily protein
MLKTTLIAAGAMLALAGPTLAQPMAKGAAALDANNDGKVTLAEFQAGRGAQMFKRLDANGDGKLSQDEFAAMRQGRKREAGSDKAAPAGKGAGRMWARVDADNDGFVSKAELDGLMATRFKRMDADNDGSLSAEELKAKPERAKVGI